MSQGSQCSNMVQFICLLKCVLVYQAYQKPAHTKVDKARYKDFYNELASEKNSGSLTLIPSDLKSIDMVYSANIKNFSVLQLKFSQW